jgi:membrane dipeptidase
MIFDTWFKRNKKLLFFFLLICGILFLVNLKCLKTESKGITSGTLGNDSSKSTNKTDTLKMTNKQSPDTTSKFSDLNNNAFQLHYDAIVVDTHNDILMPVMMEGADLTKELSTTQSDLVRWKKGGLDIQMFSIYIPEKIKSHHFDYAMKLIDFLEKTSSNYPDMLYLTHDYDSVVANVNKGRLIGLMGAEGGNMIEGSMDNLITLYNRGVRYLGLTWNTSNAIGVSARDETERGKKGGLTEFGKEVVQKMDELGMMIDVSHLGETAFWDVVNTSKNPIIASHSDVYNLSPHYRNLKDDQIKAIAKSGGFISVNFYCKFLDPNASVTQVEANHRKLKKVMKEFENNDGDDMIAFNNDRYKYLTDNPLSGGTSIDVLIDHIDYIVKLVGIDYVGLGSDFDGGINTPNEIYDATCYPIITKKLVERGYSENDIRKILGLNFLRVFKQVCRK